MKANIYVDGFNLYYGALKNTPYRWLDIAKLCHLMLPRDTIGQIKYFTALVNTRPTDPDQLTRQQIYLRALQTIPNLEIIYGHFLTHEIMMPLAPPKNGYVKVIKTEEKGSAASIDGTADGCHAHVKRTGFRAAPAASGAGRVGRTGRDINTCIFYRD